MLGSYKDYKTLKQRVDELEAVISKLKRETLNNSMDIDTIRDKVLRKIQNRKKPKESSLGTEDDGFDSIRSLYTETP
jgi:hypothetical protein